MHKRALTAEVQILTMPACVTETILSMSLTILTTIR